MNLQRPSAGVQHGGIEAPQPSRFPEDAAATADLVRRLRHDARDGDLISGEAADAIEWYERRVVARDKVISSLQHPTPHSKDYYARALVAVQGEREAYREAIKAHRALLEGIESPAMDADNALYAVLDCYPDDDQAEARF